jgi:siroheme synthase-like protein
MSAYYPILLDLRGKRCVIFGGDKTAEGKVRGLVEANADLTLVSPSVTPAIMELIDSGAITWERREYRSGDLEGVFVAMAALEGKESNQAIWEEAEARGLLINSVDDPAHCNFILPANLWRGDLVVSVSSSGKSPTLASTVRNQIAEVIGPEYGELLDILGQLRPQVMDRYAEMSTRTALWRRIVQSDALDHLRSGDKEGALQLVQELLSEFDLQEVAR